MVESADKAVLRIGLALAQCLGRSGFSASAERVQYLARESLWVSRVTEGR